MPSSKEQAIKNLQLAWAKRRTRKGIPNRFTSLKAAFLEAFDRLGGVDGLVEWASANHANRRDFYFMLRTMLPKSVESRTELRITITAAPIR